MSYEFRDDEIKEIVRAAQIFSQSFNEEQFQALRELEWRLADSGFLEALRGLVRMEEEMGVTANQVLDAIEGLLGDKDQLEAETVDLRGKLAALQNRNQQAENEYRQQQAAIGQARGELQAIQIRCQEEEKRLASLRKKTEREKERIDQEIKEYRQKANVTKEETVLAGQIKAQVEKYGFSLELALDLSHEFAGYESAREELAQALKTSGTLKSNLSGLQSEMDRRRLEIAALTANRLQLQNILSQLQGDIATAEMRRKFYDRYQSASGLMEYLASWKEQYFLRCNNPLLAISGFFDQRTKCGRFWTEKPPVSRCPCCDHPGTIFDSQLYQLLNWPVGHPYKLQLGEDK